MPPPKMPNEKEKPFGDTLLHRFSGKDGMCPKGFFAAFIMEKSGLSLLLFRGRQDP